MASQGQTPGALAALLGYVGDPSPLGAWLKPPLCDRHLNSSFSHVCSPMPSGTAAVRAIPRNGLALARLFCGRRRHSVGCMCRLVSSILSASVLGWVGGMLIFLASQGRAPGALAAQSWGTWATPVRLVPGVGRRCATGA